MTVLNYYSFLILSVLIFGVLAAVVLHAQRGWREYLMLGGVAVILLGAWLVLHPRQSPLSADAGAVRDEIGAGLPVLLEFQSPYCLACTAMQPKVDALEAEYAGQLRVIRVNIQTEPGRELTAYYGFEYTPTFIFFSADGQELWREVGALNLAHVRMSLEE